jgi:hypothetical protein
LQEFDVYPIATISGGTGDENQESKSPTGFALTFHEQTNTESFSVSVG